MWFILFALLARYLLSPVVQNHILLFTLSSLTTAVNMNSFIYSFIHSFIHPVSQSASQCHLETSKVIQVYLSHWDTAPSTRWGGGGRITPPLPNPRLFANERCSLDVHGLHLVCTENMNKKYFGVHFPPFPNWAAYLHKNEKILGFLIFWCKYVAIVGTYIHMQVCH